jgi:hypothetical protein
MTRVAIFPEPTESGVTYRAVAGRQQSTGKTAGEALDALTARLPPDGTTLVIVQTLRPDAFFTAEQQRRLGDLMNRWRSARDAGTGLPALEQKELEALQEAELRAATQRAVALLDELRS